MTWFFEGRVIRTHDFDFPDVALDDGFVEADGLNEEELEALFDDDFFVQLSASLLRRVRRVENGDFAVVVLQVVEDVIKTFLTNLKIIKVFGVCHTT
jgi:hypothetical protein